MIKYDMIGNGFRSSNMIISLVVAIVISAVALAGLGLSVAYLNGWNKSTTTIYHLTNQTGIDSSHDNIALLSSRLSVLQADLNSAISSLNSNISLVHNLHAALISNVTALHNADTVLLTSQISTVASTSHLSVPHVYILLGQSNMVGYNGYDIGNDGTYSTGGGKIELDPENDLHPRVWQFAPGAHIDSLRVPLPGGETFTMPSNTYTITADGVDAGTEPDLVYSSFSFTTSTNARTAINVAGEFTPARNPLGFVGGGVGISPATTMAKEILKTLPDSHFAVLVPMAYSGTSLTVDGCDGGATGYVNPKWTPGNPGASLYENAIFWSNLALSKVAQRFGRPAQNITFIWVQGEGDVCGAAVSQYEAALDALIVGMRSRITNATNAPFVVGQMVPDWIFRKRFDGASALANIDLIHRDTPRRLPFTSFVPGIYGYGDFDRGTGNDYIGLHYSALGQHVQGRRFAQLGLPQALANHPTAGVVPAAVANLTASRVSIRLDSITLFWNASATYTRITDYRIYYKRSNDSVYSTYNHTAFIDPTTIKLVGLSPFTSYNLFVKGVNEAGEGAASTVITISTIAENTVINLVPTIHMTTAITIQWQAPPAPTMPTITNYIVLFKSTSATIYTHAGTTDSSTLTLSVTGLTASTFYDFSVIPIAGLVNGTAAFLLSVPTDEIADLPAPYSRFRADRGVVLDSDGLVEKLLDQSGNSPSRHADSTTPGYGPYKHNRPIISRLGSVPVVQFRNTQQWLRSAVGFPFGGHYTINAVLSFDDFRQSGNILSSPSYADPRFLSRGGGQRLAASHDGGSVSGGILIPDTFYMFTATFNNTSPKTLTMYQNGKTYPLTSGWSAVSDGIETPADAAMYIGSHNIDGSGGGGSEIGLPGFGPFRQGGNWKMVSITVWNSVLTSAQILAESDRVKVYHNITLGDVV